LQVFGGEGWEFGWGVFIPSMEEKGIKVGGGSVHYEKGGQGKSHPQAGIASRRGEKRRRLGGVGKSGETLSKHLECIWKKEVEET